MHRGKGEEKEKLLGLGLRFPAAARGNWLKLLGGRDRRIEVICLEGVVPFPYPPPWNRREI